MRALHNIPTNGGWTEIRCRLPGSSYANKTDLGRENYLKESENKE